MSGIIGGVRAKSGVIGIESRESNVYFSGKRGGYVTAPNYILTYQILETSSSAIFDNTTGIFTAPVSGNYALIFGCLSGTANTRTEILLHKLLVGGSWTQVSVHNGSSGDGNYDGGTTTFISNCPALTQWRVKLQIGTMYGQHDNNIFSGFLI